MWLIILYAITQIILWFIYHDFSALSKSSDIFAILSTLDIMKDSSSFDYLLDQYDKYLQSYILNQILYDVRSIRRKVVSKLDRIFGKGFRTLLFTIIALALKIYS
jgi:hypothetical protein